MKTVILQKPYNHYPEGKIITLENNIAGQLISNGIARVISTRDYLVKPQNNLGVITRAFRKPH
jgi:dsRNA-specific ribonuclease